MPGPRSKVILTAFALTSGVLSTQVGRASEGSMIDKLTTENVTAILKDWGATGIVAGKAQEKRPDGSMAETPYLMFSHSALTYIAFFYACGDLGCSGLQVVAAFEAPATPLEVLNAFNARHRAGKAYTVEGGFVSERYIIVDDGVARENIVLQLQVFESITAVLLSEVKQAKVVALSSPTSPVLNAIANASTTSHTGSIVRFEKLPLNNLGR